MRRVLAIVFAGVLVVALCSLAVFHQSLFPPAPGAAKVVLQTGAPVSTHLPVPTSNSSASGPSLAYERVFVLHDATNRYGAFAIRPTSGTVRPIPSGQFITLNAEPKYTGPVLIGSAPITADKPVPPAAPTLATASSPLQTPANETVASVGGNGGTVGANLVADDTPSAFDARLQDSTSSVSMPIRVGVFSLKNLTTSAHFDEAPSSDVRVPNYSWTAGTNFDVQAKRHEFGVNVNTNYEHLDTGSQVASFSYDENSNALSALSDLEAANPALFAAYTSAPIDVTSQGVTGGVALPLNHRVTLGFQYGAQRFTGSYGLAGTPNLDTSKYSYLGNLTFALRPNTAITFSARQYRYQDNLVPSNNYFQTRADVNFTVKL